MKLLSIEISGFKSFANPVRIPIDKDIIGFIGPNGCGKSNIVDAIKWVIGEQNPREIRCERISDVIFNGSTLRAAHGMAEVTLRLSNEDKKIPLNFNEIEITRRLYKNGDSEYLMNRTPMRLKDINRFLSGTGLGESSYTLFKPSAIDDLLRPNSMLINDILTEASGIAKYKLDKKETLRKLSLTREAMKRGEDIIAEVTQRFKELKHQSDKVRRYNKLKEKIYNKEKLFYMGVYGDIIIKLEGLDGEIGEYRKKEMEKIGKLNSLEENRKSLDKSIVEISDKREGINAAIDSVNNELNMVIGEKSTVLAEMKNIGEQSKNLLAEKKELTEKIPIYRQKIEVMEKENTNLGKYIEKHKSGMKELDSLVNKITKEIAIKDMELAKRRKELEAKRDILHKTLNELELEKRTYQFSMNKINDLKEQLDLKSEEIRKIKEEIPLLEDKLAEDLTKEEKLKNTVQAMNKKLLSINRNIEKNREELRQAEGKLGNMKGQYGILKEMEENNEGIGQEPLKFRNAGKSLLMDVVESNQGHEDLAEGLLFDYRDTVLLNDEKELKELIQKMLSNGGGGRVKFIFKKGNHIKKDILNAFSKGTEYLPLFIAGTKIVDSIDGIDYKCDAPQITRNGKVFFYGNFASVSGDGKLRFIGRKKQLESLEMSIKDIEKRITELRGKIDKFTREQTELLNDINSKEKEAVQLTESISVIEEKIRSENAKAEAIETEIEDIREEIAEYSVNADDLMQKIQKLENTIVVAREELPVVDTYEGELAELRQKLSDLNKNKQEMLIEGVHKENELENGKKLLKELREKTDYANEKINNIENRLKEFAGKMEYKKQQIRDYEAKERELRGTINKLREEDGKYREQIMEFRKNIESAQRGVLSLEEELEEIRREIEDIKIKRESFKIRMDDVVKKLKNRFEIDIKEHFHKTDEIIPEEDEIEQLKERLRNMGEINPLALKEYEEVKARLDFLNQQRNDLMESEKSLLKTIEISDRRAKEDFKSNFNTVKKNYNEIFVELFGGGKSDIVIEDAENPVESKITIYAQPPGKRVKNIAMLSTGEQMLAAIALLFAIYETKPSPFCFMDEIDAPLDDANVERFIKLLKRLKNKSQILMITHNRRSMEACEYIYGVTMEDGISKVVSINLQKEVNKWV